MENFQTQTTTKSKEEVRREIIAIDKAEILSGIIKASYWFYLIAALSLINSLMTAYNKGVAFQLGLGITQIIDGVVLSLFGKYNMIATLLDVIIAGVFAGLGYLSWRLNKWALTAGIILYGLDALIFLYFKMWVAFIIHIFVMYMLFKGYKLIGQYSKLLQEENTLRQ